MPAFKKIARNKSRVVLSQKIRSMTKETVLSIGCRTASRMIVNSGLCPVLATKNEVKPGRQISGSY